ncbi:AzlD family protein [Vibrio alginolyticus]|uniref:AzlD family protein n=1 Tax=Vibrio alginolyticus TaxID=663 RepID=UPI001BD6DF1A|nr:AzlD domain-containing protein [Vibrio alginolyticus]MBS9954483.1 AzlD domain-containing protein [Vibrio alginolyticus]
MMIDTTGTGTWLLIIIMAIITIVTRWGGIFIMSYVPINYRVQQFIAAMSGAVLIAIIAPMLITSDLGGKLALLVTAFGTLILKKPLFAILAGMFMAAVIRGI